MAIYQAKQVELLKQFRKQLEEQDHLHEGDTIGTDDATLLRFLRARHFDLKAATTMWANCFHWRKIVEGVGIDQLYRRLDPYDYPERPAVFECWPLWFHKTDKKGRPLNIHYFGGINMPELYKHITPEKFWQTIIVNAESLTREVLPASARAAGRHIDGTFVIVDLKNFGISQFWQMKNLARDSFQISQDYFPETMAQLAIINAPGSFTTIWSLIKPWLAKETLAKIDILGSDYREVLLEQIPDENLPVSLGGTCTCEEAGGCKLSNAGPWMHNRTQRREKWMRGDRKRLGLGMEGEDEDDGVASMANDDQPTQQAQNAQTQLEQAFISAEQPEQTPEDGVGDSARPVAAAYGMSTKSVREADTALKRASPPIMSPSSSSSSAASSSSFQSARSSFSSTDTLGSERSDHSTKTGASMTSAATGASIITGVSKDSQGKPKHESIKKKAIEAVRETGFEQYWSEEPRELGGGESTEWDT